MEFKKIRQQLDEAIAFAEQYPEGLRATILEFLLRSSERSRSGKGGNADHIGAEREVPLSGSRGTGRSASSGATSDDLKPNWLAALASELDVPAEKLAEIYEVGDDGTPRIRAILQDDSIPKRQIGYSELYLLAREKAGQQAATSDELRSLVRAKKAYDGGNFTRNFKATASLRSYGNPGQGNTEWVLTAAGREAAQNLVKELCSAEV